MNQGFLFSQFLSRFPTNDDCLDEIVKLRYPKGVFCVKCKKITKHYRVKNRMAYSCKSCRNHIYPLVGTIFEKSTTPLRIWFYALFIMTCTRADISITHLQRELGVTYKTAWRIYKNIKKLMEQNDGDLLKNPNEVNKLLKWTFFNKIELKVVEKETTER